MQPQGVRRVCRGRSSESVGAAFVTWGPSEKMAAAHRDTAGLPGNARLDSDRASRSSRLSTAASGPGRGRVYPLGLVPGNPSRSARSCGWGAPVP